MVLEFFEWMEGSTLSLIFQSAVWYSPLIQVARTVGFLSKIEDALDLAFKK